jgi:hypothetical protein
MTGRPLFVVTVLALVFTACGPGDQPETGANDPILQIRSEGGFVPVEVALGTGPRYTLLGDGRLIHQGAQTMEFPAPLLPGYMMAQLTPSQVDALLALVEDIGLPGIDEETDNSASQYVADASTEVVTYWDDNGPHRLSVYALGIEESPSARNAAFLDLIETLDRFTAEADTENYVPETVRVIAGPGFVNQDVQDTRSWPLDDDQTAWSELANGWTCRVLGSEVLDLFEDATQATVWEEPDLFDFPSPVKLLVRPLLPGEPDCP